MDWRVLVYYELKAAGMHHGQSLREYLTTERSKDSELQAKIGAYTELRAKGMCHGESLEQYLDDKKDR